MRSYDISSSKFSPALLDKKKKKVICCSTAFGHIRRLTRRRMIAVALKKYFLNHTEVWLKKKKVLLVNQLKNKHEYSFVTHLKP